MRSSEFSHASWGKSSYSNDGGNGACVEVAGLVGRVAMRDSKDPTGVALAFPRAQWHAFLTSVRAGELA
ncbi:MAG: DUF397 domain-containing protein [Pseudonocardiales bacterium]|nr:DUF397 domain-containing protein [Pseudonocardiales bacterium]